MITTKHHLKVAVALAHLLDTQFSLFGFRFGIDPILGLVPGLGDVISFIFSSYLIFIARHLNIPQKEINRMILHLVIDLIIGIVPIIGEIGDFWYKANAKNLRILKKYAPKHIIDAEIIE